MLIKIAALAVALALVVPTVGCSDDTATPPTRDGAIKDAAVKDTAVSPDHALPTGDGVKADAPATCPVTALEWKSNGGMVAFRYVHQLASCQHYTLSKAPNGGAASVLCALDLSASDANLVAALAALAGADVQQALSTTPTVYGTDPRPVDGTVLEVTADGKSVLIGGDCNGATGCTAIPAGLKTLRDNLGPLGQAMIARTECQP